MVRHVRSYPSARRNPQRVGVDLEAALEASPAKVRYALYSVHEALNDAGVRHILVGGLAVAAHGFRRATHDIDFMVTNNAFVGKTIIMHAPGVPIAAHNVLIDYLGHEAAIDGDRLLKQATGKNLDIIPIEQLVAMKLEICRPKDRADVAGLHEAGAFDPDEMAEWLHNHGRDDLATKLRKVLE